MATTQKPRPQQLSTELPPERVWTADEVRDLVDESRAWPRFECARGRLLVTPSPRSMHQFVVQRLAQALGAYCDTHFDGGVTLMAPADISWGRDDVTLQPDVFVVPHLAGRAATAIDLAGTGTSTEAWQQIRHLLLAAEVLSPGSETYDRGDKRLIYQAEGTPLYWVVDWRQGQVEEWTPEAREARVERERLVWHPAGAAVPFELALAHLFRPV